MPLDRNSKITPNFRWEEFIRAQDADPSVTVIENIRALAKKLEDIRAKLGNRKITISSGFRTPKHNKEEGGAKYSQHLYGKAADFEVEGMDPIEVQLALDWWPGGLGYGHTFTHLDTRSKKTRFYY